MNISSGLVLLILSLLIAMSKQDTPNCGRNCGGCISGRCDVFNCNAGYYCCLDLHSYGACCTTCANQTNCQTIPPNTGCLFYESCLESHRSCEIVQTIAYPKCQQYEALESKLSNNGKQWSSYVRTCLQQAIADKVLSKGSNFTCTEVEDAFFDSHLDCYLNGSISFCNLPPKDQMHVFLLAQGILWTKWFIKPISAGIQLIKDCPGLSFWEIVAEGVKEVIDFNLILSSLSQALGKALLPKGMNSGFVPTNATEGATWLVDQQSAIAVGVTPINGPSPPVSFEEVAEILKMWAADPVLIGKPLKVQLNNTPLN